MKISPVQLFATSNSFNLSFTRTRILLTGLLLAFGLVSCGGGGGGPPAPTLTVDSPTIVEGQTGTAEMIFTVSLSENAASALTMDYTTVDGSATTADGDYTTVSGSLTIPAGSSTANVSVFANGDATFEQNETVSLMLSNPQGLTIATSPINGQGSITNDDNAVPKGYFTGTATVNSTAYSDMTALVYNNRILLTSPSANVLYDIAMVAPTVNDYTGTVAIYVNGNIEQVGAVTISGTTNELSIQGIFASGTGFAIGSFDVAFDAANNKRATLPRIEATGVNQWAGNLYGIDVDNGRFSSSNTGNYVGTDDNTDFCAFPITSPSSFVIPNANTNIYEMAHAIDSQGVGACAPPYESTGHTGFASVVDDTGTDDKLVFAFANGAVALFGIMNR